jgi:hypothetical protein
MASVKLIFKEKSRLKWRNSVIHENNQRQKN